MSQISGIYDSGVISPVAKIKENLAVRTQGQWEYFQIDYIEPIPPTPDSTVELITTSGATNLAAGGTITKQLYTVIQSTNSELLHLRFMPLDYGMEVLIWELAGQAKFKTRNIHARVDYNSYLLDPTFNMTTFFVLGRNDANIELRNASTAVIPMARLKFWGFRYNLRSLVSENHPQWNLLKQGDVDTVRQHIGPVTWVPAEGNG